MLQPEQLDPWILEELEQSTDLCDIEAPIPGPILDPAEGLQTLMGPSGDLQAESGLQDALDLIDELLQANRTTDSLRAWREKASGPRNDWALEKGLLKYQSRLVVPEDQNLRTRIIAEVHNQVSTAHPGKNKTRQLIRTRYYWPGLISDIDWFVRNCDTCRRSTVPRDKTPGLLQPLPIPERPWLHISMDFHELPLDKSRYNMVFVLVDRFGKRTISIPCHKTIDAKEAAWLFIHYVYWFYGPPDTIVSDRGPQFVSAFWKEFTRILGIKLKLSTAYNPQTDGQTEITNQYLDQRLRPFVNHFQDNWSGLLPMMDYAQATLPHDSTGYAPIQLEMGYLPRTSFDWAQPEPYRSVREKLSTEEAKVYMKRLESAWELARANIRQAQERMQEQANKHRREPDFGPGDKVWITTRNWKTDRPSRKLDHQMAGPYTILEKVGNAFRVQLPDSIKVHPVFAANKLRKAASDPLPGQKNNPPPPIEVSGEQEWEVEKILNSRLSRNTLQYQVSWVGYDPDPTWYPAWDFVGSPQLLKEFHEAYPTRPGPPKYLDEWLECWHTDKDPQEHLDKNTTKA